MAIEQDLLNVVTAATDLTQTVQTKITDIDARVNTATQQTIDNTNARITQLDSELDAFKAATSVGTPGWHKYEIELADGRPDMFYPVRIYAPSDSSNSSVFADNMIHDIQISRYYSRAPRPAADNGYVNYNGSHWMACQISIRTTGGNWDGGPSWTQVENWTYAYRPAATAIRMQNEAAPYIWIWLRGGCNYSTQSSVAGAPVVYCLDEVPVRIHSYNRGTYLDETWINSATLDHFITGRSIYEGREIARGADTRTVDMNINRYVSYYLNRRAPLQAYSWEQADYQDAAKDIENQQPWGTWSTSTKWRDTGLEVVNDQMYLANKWCRRISTSDFPNRISGKGVMEYFTADEFEITADLDDYVAV